MEKNHRFFLTGYLEWCGQINLQSHSEQASYCNGIQNLQILFKPPGNLPVYLDPDQ